MKINTINGKTIYADDKVGNMKDLVVIAAKSGANLSGADLSDAQTSAAQTSEAHTSDAQTSAAQKTYLLFRMLVRQTASLLGGKK
jgi:uncharacterized protein YjbI with pentapeptide repeats